MVAHVVWQNHIPICYSIPPRKGIIPLIIGVVALILGICGLAQLGLLRNMSFAAQVSLTVCGGVITLSMLDYLYKSSKRNVPPPLPVPSPSIIHPAEPDLNQAAVVERPASPREASAVRKEEQPQLAPLPADFLAKRLFWEKYYEQSNPSIQQFLLELYKQQ